MKFAWITEPPFNFADGSRVTGHDVELARLIAERLGEVFEPVETQFHQLLPGLRDGRWDMTTGMFVTPEREKHAAFTNHIWALQDGLLMLERNKVGITGYRDIANSGKKMAVLKGQIQKNTAVALGVLPPNIEIYSDYHEAAAAVANGLVHAYASVERAHQNYICDNTGLDFACVAVPFSEKVPEHGAFACQNIEMRDRMNSALIELWLSGKTNELLTTFGLDDCCPRQL